MLLKKEFEKEMKSSLDIMNDSFNNTEISEDRYVAITEELYSKWLERKYEDREKEIKQAINETAYLDEGDCFDEGDGKYKIIAEELTQKLFKED